MPWMRICLDRLSDPGRPYCASARLIHYVGEAATLKSRLLAGGRFAMTRVVLIPLAFALSILSVPASAAPAPKEAPVTPISAENASQVKPILEVPNTVYRLVRGPNRGALILCDRSRAAEVVDDISLRPIRTLAKDHLPTDLAVSPDGKLMAFTERNSSGYTVREIDGDKSFGIEIGGNPGCAAFSSDGKLLAIGFTHWAQNAGEGYSEV